MSKGKDVYEILIENDELYISALATGIIFRILPETEWSNMQAFWAVLVIYAATFSCVSFIKAKIKQHKANRYFTVKRMDQENVG